MAQKKIVNTKVAKTVKLFIGGEFPRTESGRSFQVLAPKTKTLLANVCLASRKDLRNAVSAAQTAQNNWQSRSAFNRSQILYRMAEMMEGKRQEFKDLLIDIKSLSMVQADKHVTESIDALVYFAGFADKYQQVSASVNPVSGPHHNFTTAEPVGVVGLICNSKFDLKEVVSQIAAIICSGNSLVMLLSEEGSLFVTALAEVFATSDLPKGVVNILTGDISELYKHFGSHMEIHSLTYSGKDATILSVLKSESAENMKRVIASPKELLSLEHLLGYVEYKTVWHPMGH